MKDLITQEKDQNFSFYRQIRGVKAKETFKNTSNRKAILIKLRTKFLLTITNTFFTLNSDIKSFVFVQS